MKNNTSADGLSINNMKNNKDSPYPYFNVVKARFKNCVFSSKQPWFKYISLSFDNCSFQSFFNMYPLNNLLGSGYNNTHVFFIRCTIDISGLFLVNEIDVKDVDLQIHIVQSNFIGLKVLLKILPRDTNAVRPVAHLTIHDSIINDTSIKMVTKDSTAVGIVQITNTILTQTVVKCTDYALTVTDILGENGYRSVQAAFFIDNCTFIQSSLHSPKSIIVYILNSRFECQTKRCALTLTGPNDVDMEISHINAMCDLFKIKMCYGIKLSNIDFISTESKT